VRATCGVTNSGGGDHSSGEVVAFFGYSKQAKNLYATAGIACVEVIT
jgi:hypothetical protein